MRIRKTGSEIGTALTLSVIDFLNRDVPGVFIKIDCLLIFVILAELLSGSFFLSSNSSSTFSSDSCNSRNS